MLKLLPRIGSHSCRQCCRQSSTNLTSSKMTSTPADGSNDDGGGEQRYKSFDEMISQRRNEAKKSILVYVPYERATKTLVTYCSRFGKLSNCFTFRNKYQANHCLVEFKNSFGANAVLSSIAKSQRNENASKSLSHFLVFSPKTKLVAELEARPFQTTVQRCATETRNLSAMMGQQASLDEQVKQLYEQTRLSELATRLRFMAALQIETMVNSIFPSVRALPFGSSVNGFGRMGSDLDVVLSFDETQAENDSPLKFHSREQHGSERYHHMAVLQTITTLMEKWTPGVANMQPVLNAKVPIIKYKQSFLDLDVDLSAHNLSGYYMSELLYLFGEIDARVRPLNFFVRRWAEEWIVTRVIRPGPWISNFTLSCLVLFFLQQLKQPILPSIDELKRQALSTDRRSITENSDCIFLRDISRLNFKSTNYDSLEQLIAQFFAFCASLDFDKTIISLNAGRTLSNDSLRSTPMHIINPLEPELNVSANVSHQEMIVFKRKAKEARQSFAQLQRDFVPTDPEKFVQFFQHKQGNDFRGIILSRMNAEIQRTVNPENRSKSTRGERKSTISVRSLTKLT